MYDHSGKTDAIASKKDMYVTYLPSFEALVDADVESVMGAYNYLYEW